VVLALSRPGAEASPDVTITVDSAEHNDTRDDWLTLREAVLLATGDLSLDSLTQEECDQVSDTSWESLPPPAHCEATAKQDPGAGSADTIVFDTSVFSPFALWPVPIDLEPPYYSLDTGNDTVDGTGAWVIIEGEGWDLIGTGCFVITSDNNTIKGLEIRDCNTAVLIIDGAQNNTVIDTVLSDSSAGVLIGGSGTEHNTVIGNYIGTDVSGQWANRNEAGVVIGGNAQNNIVRDNLISGNRWGVEMFHDGTTGNSVLGNYIGTDVSGTTPIPNEFGVEIRSGAHDNLIGGTAPGEGNLIAYNTEDGVLVDGTPWDGTVADGNTIRGNSIHFNWGKAIENSDGGNAELAPPTVETAGSVFGTSCANCTVDIYSDDEDEGRVYEGSTTADGDGNWSFSGTPEGPNITATATDSDGNTSEFSPPLMPPWPAPSPSPTPSPTPGATRTLDWGPGWHNATWSGASDTAPATAFACAAGNYAAAYRLVGGGWERHFPGRPDISNMGPLHQYDAFLILVTGHVTCAMPVADPPGTERTLDWGLGWQNEGWSGPDGTAPQDAFACADGSYAAAYRLVGGGWERYFPGRPDISNMGPLNSHDAFLILVTTPVSCTMPVGP
jgi:hypothetical protein